MNEFFCVSFFGGCVSLKKKSNGTTAAYFYIKLFAYCKMNLKIFQW